MIGEGWIAAVGLEVEDLHSYFVGCVSVLVHNRCGKSSTQSNNNGFNSEQNALIQIGKDYDRKNRVSMQDAVAYVDLAKEVGLTDARIDVGHPNRTGVSVCPHLHPGFGSAHIPIV